MALSAQEVTAIVAELEQIECERRRTRKRDLKLGRDFQDTNVKPHSPNVTGGILINFPGDSGCAPDAIDQCITVDVDYSVLVPDNADVATNSIEKLSLQWEWGAGQHLMYSDLIRGVAGTFIGQRLILRWVYIRDAGTELAPITQPEVNIRASVALGCPKASPSPTWNLRKTIFVGDLQNASESSVFPIPPWAIEASLESPGAATSALVLILNQYAAPNGTLLHSAPIGKGTGAGCEIVEGARYFTVVNLGPAVISGIRVPFTLGQ